MDLLKSTERTLLNHRDLALLHGDCRDMWEVPCDSVDLVVTDPPFNVGFDYGEETNDRQPSGDYLAFTEGWLTEVMRVLKPGGQLYAIMPLKWIDGWLPMVSHLKWHILPWCRTMAHLHREQTYSEPGSPYCGLLKGQSRRSCTAGVSAIRGPEAGGNDHRSRLVKARR